MSENPSEEILVNPQRALLEFGDGYLAMILGGIESTEDGLKVVNFTIKPSQLLRKWYDIKDSQLNKNGCMNFKVYKKDLVPLNQFDDANRKWMYLKNFLHEETEISKLNWDLRKRLDETEREKILLEGELLWYFEQLQMAKSNPAEFMAQSFEVFDKMSSRIVDLIGKRREDSLL